MFVRASTLVLAIAASVAIAAPSGDVMTPTTVTSSQCDTGSLQCCNYTTNDSSTVQSLAGLLGVLDSIEGLVGIGCTPLTVLGTGSGAVCQQQPVCCTNVSQNGVINFGCSPVDLNL